MKIVPAAPGEKLIEPKWIPPKISQASLGDLLAAIVWMKDDRGRRIFCDPKDILQEWVYKQISGEDAGAPLK